MTEGLSPADIAAVQGGGFGGFGNEGLWLFAILALMGGGFSRTGYTTRIAKASAAFLIVRVLGYGLAAASAWNGWLNVLQYAAPVLFAALALRLLFRDVRPRARLRDVLSGVIGRRVRARIA